MCSNSRFGHSLRALLTGALLLFAGGVGAERSGPSWTPIQVELFGVLALPAPGDDKPRPTPSPLAELGQKAFFDPRLSADGRRSCASCHRPERHYSDGLRSPAGNPLGRNTPALSGTGGQRWYFWGGRADSLWAQAQGPLFAAHEMGADPAALSALLRDDPDYRDHWRAAFDRAPEAEDAERLFARLGQALGAWQATLGFGDAPFDRFARALAADDTTAAEAAMDTQAQAGLAVFLRSNCLACHGGGPAFRDGRFHNIGTRRADSPDRAREAGLAAWRASPWRCDGELAHAIDAPCRGAPETAQELHGLFDGAFKTPTLRNLAHTAPYLHDGSLATLEAVVEHYRHPPEDRRHALGFIPPMSDEEARQLVAFLHALSAPPPADPRQPTR